MRQTQGAVKNAKKTIYSKQCSLTPSGEIVMHAAPCDLNKTTGKTTHKEAQNLLFEITKLK